MRNEMPRDGGTRLVELGRPVACFAQKHDFPIREAVERSAECRIIKLGKGLSGLGNHLR
jgi:hypothetical protein